MSFERNDGMQEFQCSQQSGPCGNGKRLFTSPLLWCTVPSKQFRAGLLLLFDVYWTWPPTVDAIIMSWLIQAASDRCDRCRRRQLIGRWSRSPTYSCSSRTRKPTTRRNIRPWTTTSCGDSWWKSSTASATATRFDWSFCFNTRLFTVIYVCMYVCMSEYLYPARLKQSHRCAAISNKQKCLQCPFETFSGQVDWAQRGWKAVPNPCSSNSKTPIAECTVGTWNDERRSIRRPKSAPAGVSDELTVVSKVRWQLTEERLMNQQRQLELYTLPDRQPMEPTKYWRYVLTTASACDKTSCRILNAL